MTSPSINLSVNGAAVPLDKFTGRFISSVLEGILAALSGTGEVKNMTLAITGDKVSINLNGGPVPVNPFVNKILTNTVTGMVSSLRGVDGIKELEIRMVK